MKIFENETIHEKIKYFIAFIFLYLLQFFMVLDNLFNLLFCKQETSNKLIKATSKTRYFLETILNMRNKILVTSNTSTCFIQILRNK